ncbi:26027_t:CDS:2, partial [Gigaspora margarita]
SYDFNESSTSLSLQKSTCSKLMAAYKNISEEANKNPEASATTNLTDLNITHNQDELEINQSNEKNDECEKNTNYSHNKGNN